MCSAVDRYNKTTEEHSADSAEGIAAKVGVSMAYRRFNAAPYGDIVKYINQVVEVATDTAHYIESPLH